MGAFDANHCAGAALIALTLGWRGYTKRSLSTDGALSAVAVGFLSFAGDLRSGVLMITFYICGSKATKVKKEVKERLDDSAGAASIRGAHQVLACSAIATGLTLALVALGKSEKLIDFSADYTASAVTAAVLSHYACCNADTLLASELGILSTETPRFVLDLRPVPRGTNGGVTGLGLVVSGIGGAVIGLAQAATEAMMFTLRARELASLTLTHAAFGAVMGLAGSLLDSVLGACLQPTYYDSKNGKVTTAGKGERISGVEVLTNAQVNLVSVILSSALGAFVVGPMLYP